MPDEENMKEWWKSISNKAAKLGMRKYLPSNYQDMAKV